jgi:hypothetical protein
MHDVSQRANSESELGLHTVIVCERRKQEPGSPRSRTLARTKQRLIARTGEKRWTTAHDRRDGAPRYQTESGRQEITAPKPAEPSNVMTSIKSWKSGGRSPRTASNQPSTRVTIEASARAKGAAPAPAASRLSPMFRHACRMGLEGIVLKSDQQVQLRPGAMRGGRLITRLTSGAQIGAGLDNVAKLPRLQAPATIAPLPRS